MVRQTDVEGDREVLVSIRASDFSRQRTRGGAIGMDPASAYATISVRCLSKCVAIVCSNRFHDNLLLGLFVDNFHKCIT